MKKCTPLWREAHFQVKMHKTHHARTTFGSSAVEKVHAAAARSTFPSQNVQSTPFSDHFWKLRCQKSASRCGAKHISKSKCTKHTMLGPLLEVQLSKKCTPLRHEAHFQVKMYKAHHSQTTFGSWDVKKVQAVVARSTFPSQKCPNTRGSAHFLTFRCRPPQQQQQQQLLLLLLLLKQQQLLQLLQQLQLQLLQQIQLLQQLQQQQQQQQQQQLHNNYNHYITLCHYTPTIWLQLHYTNYTTPQLQLHYATTTTTAAVHHTTSSSCGWGDHCNHCNRSNKHNPTTFRSISGFALPSVIHNNQPLL